MKKGNSDILKYVLEILLAMVVIVFTGVIWDNNKLASYSTTAARYENIEVVELYVEDLETNDDALQSVDLIVRNHGKNADDYRLALVINKKSKLDLDNLLLRIDGQVVHSNSLDKFENQYNIFYIINESILTGYTQDEIEVDILFDGQQLESLYLTFVLDKGQFQ